MLTPQQQDNLDFLAEFEEVQEPTKAYLFNRDVDKVVGTDDELAALEQAIFLYLSIERYDHNIYSWSNFVEFKDLFGLPTGYVASEVPRRITECLLQDERITGVDSFDVTASKNVVSVRYIVRSIYGDLEAEREVIYG